MNNYSLNNTKRPGNKKKKKATFKNYKDNTIHSLNETEYFLRNLKNISKAIKIKKIFK